MQKQTIPLNNDMSDIKVDDHIFTTELEGEESDEGLKLSFNTREYVVKEIFNTESHIEGIDMHENSIPVEVRDVNFPDTPIKTDIARGFFKTKSEAVITFTAMLKTLYDAALEECKLIYENEV